MTSAEQPSQSRRFEGKVAIVTGGVSGIGASVTERLVSEGARVIAVDIKKDHVEAASAKFGPAVIGEVADVTQEQEFAAVVERTISRFGDFHVLVNVAGGARFGSLLDISEDDWNFAFRLNVNAQLFGIRLAARHFIDRGYAGTVVNVASLAGFTPNHGSSGYSVSKAASIMLTRQAALELSEHGIRINSISPGLIKTQIMEDMFLGKPGIEKQYLDRIPMGRAGRVDEIAAAIAFLASQDASYLSGENMVVDGAWSQSLYPDVRNVVR